MTMRIDFESSGGYANLQLSYHGDTNEVRQDLAEQLLALVESSRVFDVGQDEVGTTPPGAADFVSYRLSIREGGRTNSLSFNDITAPTALHPLVAFLRKLALEQRQGGG